MCIQCANRRRVPYPKVQRDIDKLVKAPSGKPDKFRLVAGSSVSAKISDRIKRTPKTKTFSSLKLGPGRSLRSCCTHDASPFSGGLLAARSSPTRRKSCDSLQCR